jgi:hypothetical protein
VLVSAVLLGVDLGALGHEAGGVVRVRLGEQGVVGGLGMIAELVPLGGELVVISSEPMVLRGEQMRLDSGVSGHSSSVAETA